MTTEENSRSQGNAAYISSRFVDFCHRAGQDFALADFLDALALKQKNSNGNLVYLSDHNASEVFFIQEGNQLSYWQIEFCGQCYVFPRPATNDKFHDLGAFNCSGTSVKQGPRYLKDCVPILVEANRHGSWHGSKGTLSFESIVLTAGNIEAETGESDFQSSPDHQNTTRGRVDSGSTMRKAERQRVQSQTISDNTVREVERQYVQFCSALVRHRFDQEIEEQQGDVECYLINKFQCVLNQNSLCSNLVVTNDNVMPDRSNYWRIVTKNASHTDSLVFPAIVRCQKAEPGIPAIWGFSDMKLFPKSVECPGSLLWISASQMRFEGRSFDGHAEGRIHLANLYCKFKNDLALHSNKPETFLAWVRKNVSFPCPDDLAIATVEVGNGTQGNSHVMGGKSYWLLSAPNCNKYCALFPAIQEPDPNSSAHSTGFGRAPEWIDYQTDLIPALVHLTEGNFLGQILEQGILPETRQSDENNKFNNILAIIETAYVNFSKSCQGKTKTNVKAFQANLKKLTFPNKETQKMLRKAIVREVFLSDSIEAQITFRDKIQGVAVSPFWLVDIPGGPKAIFPSITDNQAYFTGIETVFEFLGGLLHLFSKLKNVKALRVESITKGVFQPQTNERGQLTFEADINTPL
jgi:hypothetical protein